MSSDTPETKRPTLLGIEIIGIRNEACKIAVDEALGLLAKKLPSSTQELIVGTVVTIANGLIESGGVTNAEEKKVILDATKNAMSLQAAEDLLVDMGILAAGEWTKALPKSKDQEWSCLTYQLVHEFGHLIDGLSNGNSYERLDPQLSPTRYGTASFSESFAEAFTYWVFDLDLSSQAEQVITGTINQTIAT